MKKIPEKKPSKGKASPRKPSGGTARPVISKPPKARAPKAAGLFQPRTVRIAAVAGVIVILAAAGIAVGLLSRSAAIRRDRENTLRLVQEYTDKGEYQRALELMEKLLLSQPDDPKLKAALDDVLTKKRAKEDAVRQQELASLQKQQDQLKESLTELGDTIKKKTTPQIVIQEPKKPSAEEISAKEQEKEKQKEREKEKKVADLLKKGAALFNAQKYAEARKVFDDILSLDGESAEALSYSALSLWKQSPGDAASIQKATDLSNKAIEKNPNLWVPHNTLAEIYESRKLNDDAMREYRTASRLAPGNPDILYSLGRLQYMGRQYREALQSFDSCLQIKPDHVNANFRKALSLVRLGEKAKALDALQATIKVKKDLPEAWYYVGTLQRDRGNTTAAVEALKKAIELAPGEPIFPRELGSVYTQRGDFPEAEAAYAKALSVDPQHASTNSNMANVKLKLDKPKEALPFAQKAVEKDPESAEDNYTLGLVNEQLGNTDEAIKYYSIAIQKNPKYAPPLINLGAIYDAKGFSDKALPLLVSATQIDPASYEAVNDLGNVYQHKGLYQESVVALKKAISLKADALITRYNLGLAYIQLDQTADAKQTLVELIRLGPNYWDAYLTLAQILIKEGSQADAKTLLSTLLAKNPKYAKSDEARNLLARLN